MAVDDRERKKPVVLGIRVHLPASINNKNNIQYSTPVEEIQAINQDKVGCDDPFVVLIVIIAVVIQ